MTSGTLPTAFEMSEECRETGGRLREQACCPQTCSAGSDDAPWGPLEYRGRRTGGSSSGDDTLPVHSPVVSLPDETVAAPVEREQAVVLDVDAGAGGSVRAEVRALGAPVWARSRSDARGVPRSWSSYSRCISLFCEAAYPPTPCLRRLPPCIWKCEWQNGGCSLAFHARIACSGKGRTCRLHAACW